MREGEGVRRIMSRGRQESVQMIRRTFDYSIVESIYP